MRMASLLQRVPGFLDWPSLAPEDVLAMATVNGGRAFGLEDEIGTIEPGKRADLIPLAGDRVREPLVDPRHNVIEVLVRCARAEHVRTVLVGGRVLLNEGRVTTFDEQQVMRDTRRHYETLWNQRDREREQMIEDGLVYVRRFFKPWEANVLPARYRFNCL